MQTKAIFIGEEYIKDNSPINPNVSAKTIYFTIWTTQEEKILPALGTALYKRLIEGILNPTDDAKKLTADEKTLLDDYVAPALMFYVLAELPHELTYKTGPKGTTTKGASAEGSEVLDMAGIARIIKRYTSKGDFRLEQLINFLRENSAGNKFPQYLNPGTGIDTIRPERKAYRSAIVLDDLDTTGSNTRGRGYNNEIPLT